MILAVVLALTGFAQTEAAPDPSQPAAPAITVGVPAGRCRITIDGEVHTLTGFANVVQTWRGSRRRLIFTPYPTASYRCVDRVLAILKTADNLELGFIGNEYVEPEKRK